MISFLIPRNATFWKHNRKAASEAFKNMSQFPDKLEMCVAKSFHVTQVFL